MADTTARPAQILRERATLLAETGKLLAAEIEQAAELLRQAKAKGNMISVCGDRTSGALVAAAGFDYEVFLPPGRAGDIILAVLPDEPTDDLLGVIAAARKRGITAIAIQRAASSSLDGAADLYVGVPTNDSQAATLAMAAVLHVLRVLVEPTLLPAKERE